MTRKLSATAYRALRALARGATLTAYFYRQDGLPGTSDGWHVVEQTPGKARNQLSGWMGISPAVFRSVQDAGCIALTHTEHYSDGHIGYHYTISEAGRTRLESEAAA